MSIVKKPDNPWYYYLGSELVKKQKPCLTGDFVHLHSRSGCYKVYATTIGSFTIMKNREEVKVPWKDFRCLQGQGNSEETLLKRELRYLIGKINYSVSSQIITSELLNEELKNLRRTFV